MNSGAFAWVTPIDERGNDHTLLKDLDIPPTGEGNWSFPTATKTLVLAAEGERIVAMNKATGAIVGETPLGAPDGPEVRVSGAPMTYMDGGKQYIVVAVDTRDGGKLVALALP